MFDTITNNGNFSYVIDHFEIIFLMKIHPDFAKLKPKEIYTILYGSDLAL